MLANWTISSWMIFDKNVESSRKNDNVRNFSKFCMLENITDEIWTYAGAEKGKMLTGLGLYVSDSLDDM